MSTDIFRPELWHDFFVMVGGGAAALAGLVFVAISMNLEIVAHNVVHKNRAIGTLTGFTAVFMICGFALIADQNYKVFGVEWLVVSASAAYIYFQGIIRALKNGTNLAGSFSGRAVFGTICYLAQIIGSVIFIMGHATGLYIASLTMVFSFALLISGSWLLIIGIHEGQHKN